MYIISASKSIDEVLLVSSQIFYDKGYQTRGVSTSQLLGGAQAERSLRRQQAQRNEAADRSSKGQNQEE